ncbi:MAG: type II toxin-antitoxin system VapC family toxin [Gemmatimonadota bacterium]
MRVLVDTECWLWMIGEPGRLSRRSRSILRSLENELFFSAVSSWEIVIKHALGRLPLPQAPARLVPRLLARTTTSSLPVHHSHALAVADLPHHHRDPFDRILIAQARVEGLPILTSDRHLAAYDVEILWA